MLNESHTENTRIFRGRQTKEAFKKQGQTLLNRREWSWKRGAETEPKWRGRMQIEHPCKGCMTGGKTQTFRSHCILTQSWLHAAREGRLLSRCWKGAGHTVSQEDCSWVAISDLEEEPLDCTHIPFLFPFVATLSLIIIFFLRERKGNEYWEHRTYLDTAPAAETMHLPLHLPSPFQPKAVTLNLITTVHWRCWLRKNQEDRKNGNWKGGKKRKRERRWEAERGKVERELWTTLPRTVLWSSYKCLDGLGVGMGSWFNYHPAFRPLPLTFRTLKHCLGSLERLTIHRLFKIHELSHLFIHSQVFTEGLLYFRHCAEARNIKVNKIDIISTLLLIVHQVLFDCCSLHCSRYCRKYKIILRHISQSQEAYSLPRK